MVIFLLGLTTFGVFLIIITAISYYLDRAGAALDDALIGLEDDDINLFDRGDRR